MKSICQLIFLIPITLCLSACGGSDSTEPVGNLENSASSAPSTNSARFSKDIGKGCEVLTAELVGTTLSVPPESLEQTRVLGCAYTWRDDAEEVFGGISRVRAHKSDAAAANWLSTSTKNKTTEEVQAELDNVAAQLGKNDELDTNAKSLANLMVNAVGAEPVVFENVANIGDEARSDADGNIHVRVENLTFIVSAYKGPREPKYDVAGMSVKELMAASKEFSQQWKNKTSAQRKKDGSQLAAAIVNTL